MRRKFLFSLAVLFVLNLWQALPLLAEERTRVAHPLDLSRDSMRAIVMTISLRYGVDPALVEAVISVESAFDPLAISAKGAMGLMQLMPETASRYGVSNPFNPRENLAGGVRYLRDLLIRFENLPYALAAYNAGETAILRYRGIPPYRETRNYVKKVIDRYRPGPWLLSSFSVLSLGQRDRDGALVLKSSGGYLRMSRVTHKDRNSLSKPYSTVDSTRPRIESGHRPLIEASLGPLVYVRKAPRASVQLRVYGR